jgi:hypothetical protein
MGFALKSRVFPARNVESVEETAAAASDWNSSRAPDRESDVFACPGEIQTQGFVGETVRLKERSECPSET